VALLRDHLGREVLGRAAERGRALAGRHLFGKAEVGDLFGFGL
jgi:hypothetical protein